MDLLKGLAETGLKVKVQKCAFLQQSVKFLGHRVSAGGQIDQKFLPLKTGRSQPLSRCSS